jgi:hypothetical protein
MNKRDLDFYHEPTVCDFSFITLKVPKKKIRELFGNGRLLNYSEIIFLKALLWRAEAAENRARHIISVINRCLNSKK